MNRTRNILLGLLLVMGVSAGRAQDDGHGAEPATVPVTLWNESMELFMEYPEMVAMKSGRFIVHLTRLDGFQPVRQGKLTLTFTAADGESEVRSTDSLLREGIFELSVGLKNPGPYTFELEYEGPNTSATFRIPDFRVHPSAGGIPGREHGADDEISFLKEQQWKIPFATEAAATGELKQSVWAIGHVLPAPTAYVEIVAPTDGIVQAGAEGDLALPGQRVQRGDVVARIAPALQGDGWTDSRLALAQARRNLERARRLREKDAISEREFEEAENNFLARQAGHEQLAGSGDGGVLSLTAPIAGQVIDWEIRPGQRLQAGDRLMAITDPSEVWLRVNVFASDYHDLGTPVGAWINNEDPGWEIPSASLKVLTTGGSLDPVTRTVPILLEIDNSQERLTINEATPVELYFGHGETATTVPRSAVYEDEGLDVVFVQTGGESFAKRVVRLGPTYRDRVGILEGLLPGERIVVRGGYHVKLAATTAEIGHGHAH